jgi:hypothetical protein
MGHFLDYTNFVTAEGVELHVYEASADDWFNVCVCSPTPLNNRQICKAAEMAARQSEENVIADELKAGESPAKIWNDTGFSAAQIGRVAKKHGIKLPRNWFSEALANTPRGKEPRQA